MKERNASAVKLNQEGETLSLGMKHSPTSQQLYKSESDITAALMNMATNTGLGRFPEAAKLHEEWDRLKADGVDPNIIPEHLSSLVYEIENEFTIDDQSRIIRTFQKLIDLDASLFSCASCGVRAFQMGDVKYHQVPLSELTILCYSDDQP
jgi:hypothetical protein